MKASGWGSGWWNVGLVGVDGEAYVSWQRPAVRIVSLWMVSGKLVSGRGGGILHVLFMLLEVEGREGEF